LCALLLIFSTLIICHNKIEWIVENDLSLHNGKADILIMLTNTGDLHKLNTNGMDWDTIGEVVVSHKMNVAFTQQIELLSLIQKRDLQYTQYWVTNCIVVSQVPEDFIREIAERNDVMLIISNREFKVPLFPEETELNLIDKHQNNTVEWNVKWVKADKAWEQGYTGKGFVVANADTGIMYNHKALVSNYRGTKGNDMFDHNYNWFDGLRNFTNCGRCPCKGTVPCDDQGHGTHCIGTACGGVDRKIGVAPGAKWIGCRAFSDMARVASPATFLNCIQFFAAPTDSNGNNPKPALRPHSTSHSYGCPSVYCPNSEFMKQAFELLQKEGVFAAVSAGNSGPGCSSVGRPPGHMASVYSVGASGTNTNTIAGFSSRGPITLDRSNRMKPDITAPGVGVWSATANGGYSAYSGTSMASPAVNGCIALIWEAVPEIARNVNATIHLINRSAFKMNVTNQCSSNGTPNNVYGYGIIDVEKAIEMGRKLYRKH